MDGCQSHQCFPQKDRRGLPLHKLKISHLESYKGRLDPADHITYFEFMTSLLDLNDAMKWRLFFTTFKKSMLKWFLCLLVNVIISFVEFKMQFLT